MAADLIGLEPMVERQYLGPFDHRNLLSRLVCRLGALGCQEPDDSEETGKGPKDARLDDGHHIHIGRQFLFGLDDLAERGLQCL